MSAGSAAPPPPPPPPPAPADPAVAVAVAAAAAAVSAGCRPGHSMRKSGFCSSLTWWQAASHANSTGRKAGTNMQEMC